MASIPEEREAICAALVGAISLTRIRPYKPEPVELPALWVDRVTVTRDGPYTGCGPSMNIELLVQADGEPDAAERQLDEWSTLIWRTLAGSSRWSPLRIDPVVVEDVKARPARRITVQAAVPL